MAESVILEEEIDEDYEPTEDEVVEYAQWLGMDPIKDRHLFYIAREGLKAPLPEPWKPCRTHDGEIYYFNFETGDSVWEHPCDEYYKKQFQEAKLMAANKGKAPLGAGSSKTKKEKEKKSSASNSISKPEVASTVIPSSLGALKPVKGAPLKAIGLGSKQDDPLIRIENEKKLKTFTERCEASHAEALREIESEGKRKINQAKNNHTDDMEDLRKKMKNERSNKEENLRDDVEEDFERRLDAVRKENDAKLQRAKEDVEYDNERRLRKIRDTIEEDGESEIKRLRETYERKFADKEKEQEKKMNSELQSYQQELKREFENEQKKVDQSQIIKRLESENEEALEEIRHTYDEKLKLEKKKLEEGHQSRILEAGEEERRRQEREFSRFKADINSRMHEMNNQGNRIRELRQKLIQEHEAKLSELKRGQDARIIVMKRNLEQDFVVEEENEARVIDREVESAFTIWNNKKLEMQNQAEFDKVAIEEEYKKKLSSFEKEIEETLSEEKEKLQKDRQATLDRLSKNIRSLDQDTDVPGLLEQISKTRNDLMTFVDDLAKKKTECGNQEAKRKETELEVEKLKAEEKMLKRQIEEKQVKTNSSAAVNEANQTMLDEMSKRLQSKEQEVSTLRNLLKTTPLGGGEMTPTPVDRHAGVLLERPHTTNGTGADYDRLERELKDIQQLLFTRLTTPQNFQTQHQREGQYNSDGEQGRLRSNATKRLRKKQGETAEEAKMIARLRSAIKTEKKQVKSLQSQLEQDKRRWKKDMEALRGKMGMKFEERRMQLQAIKSTLDHKIERLNAEVAKLKASESWIKKREKLLKQKRRQMKHYGNSDSEIDPSSTGYRGRFDDSDDDDELFKREHDREKSLALEDDDRFNQKWGHLLGNLSSAEEGVSHFKMQMTEL